MAVIPRGGDWDVHKYVLRCDIAWFWASTRGGGARAGRAYAPWLCVCAFARVGAANRARGGAWRARDRDVG